MSPAVADVFVRIRTVTGPHARIFALDVERFDQLLGGEHAVGLLVEGIDACHHAFLIDLAAESGGNVAGTVAGEVVVINGVSINGPVNVASSMPFDASQLYSRNIMALFDLIIDRKEGTLILDFEDEVIDAICVAHEGEARHGLGD